MHNMRTCIKIIIPIETNFTNDVFNKNMLKAHANSDQNCGSHLKIKTLYEWNLIFVSESAGRVGVVELFVLHRKDLYYMHFRMLVIWNCRPRSPTWAVNIATGRIVAHAHCSLNDYSIHFWMNDCSLVYNSSGQ